MAMAPNHRDVYLTVFMHFKTTLVYRISYVCITEPGSVYREDVTVEVEIDSHDNVTVAVCIRNKDVSVGVIEKRIVHCS